MRSVTVKIKLLGEMGHSFDINIIIDNLLENAIEAASQTEEKVLDVLIEFKQGVLKLEIKNSFTDKIKKIRKDLLLQRREKNYMESVYRA